jgi:hypothetical protein
MLHRWGLDLIPRGAGGLQPRQARQARQVKQAWGHTCYGTVCACQDKRWGGTQSIGCGQAVECEGPDLGVGALLGLANLFQETAVRS